jgi:hypothetical protein
LRQFFEIQTLTPPPIFVRENPYLQRAHCEESSLGWSQFTIPHVPFCESAKPDWQLSHNLVYLFIFMQLAGTHTLTIGFPGKACNWNPLSHALHIVFDCEIHFMTSHDWEAVLENPSIH